MAARNKVLAMRKEKADKRKFDEKIDSYKALVDGGMAGSFSFKLTNYLQQHLFEKKIYPTKADRERFDNPKGAQEELAKAGQ